jgi:hypothetical protein
VFRIRNRVYAEWRGVRFRDTIPISMAGDAMRDMTRIRLLAWEFG